MLLSSGLLRTQHISLWFIIILFSKIHNATWKSFWFETMMHTENLVVYTIVVLSSCWHFICFCICIKFFALHGPSILLASDQILKSTTGFIGGGRSARTDYEFLKPQIQQSASAGFVTAEKPYFAEAAKRLIPWTRQS